MGKVNFSDDFKRDAVAQITERGYPVAEVSLRFLRHAATPSQTPQDRGSCGDENGAALPPPQIL